MEIERKYLVKELPESIDSFPCHLIEQAYLSTSPVLRIRRWDDQFILTYKSAGLLERQEVELPLNASSYAHLMTKADGTVICKKRYVIPLTEELSAEVDLFSGTLDGFIMTEVEFPSRKAADEFLPPHWFGKEVTYDTAFHNSCLSQMEAEDTVHFFEHLHSLQQQ